MNKTMLIIKREYVTRVRNKTFLLSTILLPVVMLLFIVGATFFASKSSDEKRRIAVMDKSGLFQSILKSDTNKLVFVFDKSIDTTNYTKKGIDGVLYPNDSIGRYLILKTPKVASLALQDRIKSALNTGYQNQQLLLSGIARQKLDSIRRASADYYTLDNVGSDNKVSNARGNTAIGFVCGFLIYITMFVFGAMVMRGVMEEKTNRIAEVMVSSVKPFQLMLGKIIGIGAVGLTQLILWMILISAGSLVGMSFLSADTLDQIQQLQNNPALAGNPAMRMDKAAIAIAGFKSLNWTLIIFGFIFYFLGGYLFYSSLFAAVGSVINEDPQEAQSLMLPIMMPIIFGFLILMSNPGNPDSGAMVWGSIIPFTSPIVMMGRLAANPPWWQLVISMLSLIGGFLFTTWLAAKIYRTGILLYGKKASWKEMMRWAFRKS